MNIQDACENKGTLPEFPNMYCLIVKHADETLSPCWYDAKTDHFARHVFGKEVLRTDWLPFPEEEEIRPEKAGEVWRYNDRFNWLTYIELGTECLRIQCEDGTNNLAENLTLTIHNKNGWTRPYPPVEDDSIDILKLASEVGPLPEEDVERIEIEGVRWYQNRDKCIVPEIDNKIADSLLDRPPMKMILEYAKG